MIERDRQTWETEMGVGSPVDGWQQYSVFAAVGSTRCSEKDVVPFTQKQATNKQHLPVEPHCLNDLPVFAFPALFTIKSFSRRFNLQRLTINLLYIYINLIR